jgi:sortase (surface protein transpeptidase)
VPNDHHGPPATRDGGGADATSALLAALFAAVAVAVVVVATWGGPPAAPTLPAPTTEVAGGAVASEGGDATAAALPVGHVEETAVPAPEGAAERQAPTPVRLRVPALGIDAPIIGLGLRSDGGLQVPADAMVTGWWTGGAAPGERGPAVIVGHVDSHAGDGVFRRLRDLAPGDAVVIDRDDGTRVHFRAALTEVHPKAAFPTQRVYGDTAQPQLRLITCGGAFDRQRGSYEDNVVTYLALEGWST